MLADAVEASATATRFSGIVSVREGDDEVFTRAFGLADRVAGRAVTIDDQFGIASGAKGLTALTVVSLVEDGVIALDMPARAVLGRDLPLIGPDVTVEHLLAHRSGIGDYLDEDAGYDLDEWMLPVGPYELVTTEDYVAALGNHAPKFEAGTAFSYCNSGYVVLALVAERAAGESFYDLVQTRVCARAGLRDTAFLRSDQLPAGAAIGYVGADGVRSNADLLPRRGSGDGGVYTTIADVHRLWDAVFAGDVVADTWVAEMTRERSRDARSGLGYGLGLWLRGDVVLLEGCDAGVSFRSAHDPHGRRTYAVVSNTSDGAWPIVRVLDDEFAGGRAE